MRYISWNVNGLRSAQKKGFAEFVREADPDILCLQETRATADQVEIDLPGRSLLWNPAERKGYSGTLVASRQEPLAVRRGLDGDEPDVEGRVLTLEFADHYLVNVYTPNARRDLSRLEMRRRWDADFLAHLQALEQDKPVVCCGDFNVSHQEIDLANPGPNRGNAGFTDEERAGFGAFLAAGFVDTFRALHPEQRDRYSWWSYRYGVRERNIGWRLDYFLISGALLPRLRDADILDGVMGSDHCPVTVDIGLEVES